MQSFADTARFEFHRLKELGDRTLTQLSPEQLHLRVNQDDNTIAVLVQHLSGNMRSRWTDFLTTDGEKPGRERDSEFLDHPEADQADLLRRWEEGWVCLFAALAPLGEDDLSRVVRIRGEEHTVLQAICRQMTHVAYHVGQIVLLARQQVGPGWKWLSVPPGESARFNQSPQPYRRQR
jgi:hypothetical protein